MTYPADDLQVVVERRPQITHPCPLATRTGAELLVNMIGAQQHWRPLTRRQRDALRYAYVRALAAVPHDAPDGTVVPLPQLPANTHPATARSLVRRGLAADGRLTPLAVTVVAHIPRDIRRRPITTCHPTGGLL